MTRDQARRQADDLWGRRQRPGVQTVGDRLGTVVLRTKVDPLVRYEVGYYETTHTSPNGADRFKLVIKGRGASWEDALLDAQRSRGAA